MIEMNAVAAATELDAARDAGREGMSAGWCAWSAGDASLTFSLVVRPDVNMHAFHGLPFVAAMGMMDALVGTASTPGLGLAGKVGIQWPSDIVCGAPAFETSLARVAVNGGAGAAGMFAAVTVDVERAALGELGVDMADEALIEALAAAVLARVDAVPTSASIMPIAATNGRPWKACIFTSGRTTRENVNDASPALQAHQPADAPSRPASRAASSSVPAATAFISIIYMRPNSPTIWPTRSSGSLTSTPL